MTNPDGKPKSDLTPQGNAPSWVDEVLSSSRAAPSGTPTAQAAPLSGAADLKIPPSIPGSRPAVPAPPAPPQEDWVARATGGSARTPRMPQGPDVTPRPSPSSSEVLSEFMRPIVNDLGSTRSTPPAPPAPNPVQPAPVQPMTDVWATPGQPPVPYQPAQSPYTPTSSHLSGDVGQKKLIAGLLAIFLGSFGIHKFYLGMNNAGMLMLGVNVGTWFVAVVLGILLIFVGLVFTVPLAVLVSAALVILGLVEGIIYLTKSDADFERDYLIGKKAWL